MIVDRKLPKKNVVPNVEEIAREMTSSYQIMIIVKRFFRLSVGNMFAFGINNLRYLVGIAKKDFAVGVKILCELELLNLGGVSEIKNRKFHFVLHNQMVDMAVAVGNRNVIEYYFSLSRLYGFSPGLVTYNIGPLIKLLSEVSDIPSELVIYTPINIKSVNMNPRYEDVIEYLKNSELKFCNIGGSIKK